MSTVNMKGQDGESDKYHGFIVMHYRSMLEKQKPRALYELLHHFVI